ncbi:MAG: NADPH-dependent ferric siderophore reductase [Ilumatobacteraceae bacterium]|nr:NADPH-dependent ferric siderophore reductase [Ilumatobacteraceae bacterium]
MTDASNAARSAEPGSGARPGTGRRPPLDDSVALAERLGAGCYDFEVVQVVELTPSLRRVVLTADALGGFAHEAGQDLMITVDPTPGSVVRRRYTIRAHDRDLATLALHIVVHGNGPGSRWAADAAPGSRIEGIGPRGKVTLAADADWHLFVGDETFVPAAYAMLEAIPDAGRAIAVFQVASSVDERPLTPAITATVDGPTWVHRGGAATVRSVLDALQLPPGTGRAYVGGESRLVRDVRETLIERGLDAEHVAAKAYWRADVANARHGEPDSLDE